MFFIFNTVSVDLQSKSMNWFLYDRDLYRERVKHHQCKLQINSFHSITFQSNFFEITLWYGCSHVNLLHIFRTPFPKNTAGWLLLSNKRNLDIWDSKSFGSSKNGCKHSSGNCNAFKYLNWREIKLFTRLRVNYINNNSSIVFKIL